MVKLILMPKFEHQMVRRIAENEVCRNILPRKSVVTVAICQDGRDVLSQSDLRTEASYFEMLYGQKLSWTDVTLSCYTFSFEDHTAVQQQWLASTDIFFMTGFSVGRNISHVLREVFTSRDRTDDESDQSNAVQNLVRTIKSRVQYNQMLYMGTCGGACLAGEYLWTRSPDGALARPPESACSTIALFDFLMGVSLQYDTNRPVKECGFGVSSTTFQITSGAALAVQLEEPVAHVESFPSGKNNTWWNWCERATVLHQRALNDIYRNNMTGPFYHSSCGEWYLEVGGACRTSTGRHAPP